MSCHTDFREILNSLEAQLFGLFGQKDVMQDWKSVAAEYWHTQYLIYSGSSIPTFYCLVHFSDRGV